MSQILEEKIKIAYIMTSTLFGGAEKVSLNYLRNRNAKLFEISIFLLSRKCEENSYTLNRILDMNLASHRFFLARRHSGGRKNYFRLVVSTLKLFIKMRKGDYQLIHTYGYLSDIIGIIISKVINIPIISTCHGFIENTTRLRIYNKLDRLALKFFDRIICVSRQLKSDLQRSGITKVPIVVIPNGVQVTVDDETFMKNRKAKRSLFHINDEDFLLGYFGRMNKEKGLDYILIAASMLLEYGIPIKVVMIGDGPERAKLEAFAEKNGLGSRVTFLNFQIDIEEWISPMDVFVLPSLSEGTPMALLEAMAYGLPVIASAVGGVPEIITSEKTGLLVSPGNQYEIKTAILRLYKDSSLRVHISKAAKEKVARDYNTKDWANRIENEYRRVVYQNIMSKRHRPRYRVKKTISI